jgi:hypothetical protein
MNIPSSLMNQQQQPMIGSDDYRRLSLRKRNICNYNETENDDDYNDDEWSGTFYDNHNHKKKKHQSWKAVHQLDPETKNVVIAQYPSLTTAADAMQVSLPAICMAIRKHKQQVYAKSVGFLRRHAPGEELNDSDSDNDNDDSSPMLLLLEPGGNVELDNIPLSSKNKEEESSASIIDDNFDYSLLDAPSLMLPLNNLHLDPITIIRLCLFVRFVCNTAPL